MFSDLKSPSDPKFMEAFGKSYFGFPLYFASEFFTMCLNCEKLPPHQFKMVDIALIQNILGKLHYQTL